MSKKNKALGIGNAIVDAVCKVDENFLKSHNLQKGTMKLINEDELKKLQNEVKPSEFIAGGSVANSIVGLSSFGNQVYFIGKLNNDLFGKKYFENLMKENVGFNFDNETYKDSTGICFVFITPDGERTMCTYLGISNLLSSDDLDKSAIRDSQYLFLEGYLVASESALEACFEASKVAKASGTKIAISLSAEAIINAFRDQLNSLIKLGCDILFCNESEARAFSQCEDVFEAEKFLREVSSQNFITLGKEGSMIWNGNKTEIIKGFEAKAIDTNGAGDIFAGSVLHKICKGKDLKTAAKFGCYAASKQVEKFGPRLTESEYRKIKEEFS